MVGCSPPRKLLKVLRSCSYKMLVRPFRSLAKGASHALAIASLCSCRTLAGATGQIVVLWDVATGKELRQLKGHQGKITSLAFNEDGTRLASGSADTTVLIWSVEQNYPKKQQ